MSINNVLYSSLSYALAWAGNREGDCHCQTARLQTPILCSSTCLLPYLKDWV